MKLDYEVTRLITALPSKASKYNAKQLKESILKSEGRVIMGQHLLFHPGMMLNECTQTELMFAFGADMVMLNTYNFDDPSKNLGLQGSTYQELKALVGNKPIGIYMGCPKIVEGIEEPGIERMRGMIFSEEHLLQAKTMGVNFIVLGGNPGSGTSIKDVISATKRAKEIIGDEILICAGKWEDGINEKVLGDPLAEYDAKDIIKQLIDAGADCIDLPAPGSRHGITVDMIRELAEFTHRYKPGTLVLSFLNSSVEMADNDTIREIAILMKQTGADIHAIGDGGFGGGSWPENIYQLSISIKGKQYTWKKLATPFR